MGGLESQMKKEDIERTIKETKFNLKELKRIHKRFMRLDREGKGWVSVDDILQLDELKNQPLNDRIARLMTDDMGEVINFKKFVYTLSMFNDRTPSENRMKYFFQLYDMDDDNMIGESEMFLALRAFAQGTLSDDQIQNIINNIISQLDTDRDGLISYQEFKRILEE